MGKEGATGDGAITTTWQRRWLTLRSGTTSTTMACWDDDCSFGSLCRQAGGRLLRGARATTDDGNPGGIIPDHYDGATRDDDGQ